SWRRATGQRRGNSSINSPLALTQHGDRATYIASASSLACSFLDLVVSLAFDFSRTMHACVLGSMYKIQIEQ
uniref:Uncharacterized protein n=1 Tax=Aegilops tauschii subsp. strangulata TaxID=200361 RepID=A0A453B1D1_AEGTS